jgi:hypothetical protein
MLQVFFKILRMKPRRQLDPIIIAAIISAAGTIAAVLLAHVIG